MIAKLSNVTKVSKRREANKTHTNTSPIRGPAVSITRPKATVNAEGLVSVLMLGQGSKYQWIDDRSPVATLGNRVVRVRTDSVHTEVNPPFSSSIQSRAGLRPAAPQRNERVEDPPYC